ncbi:MAG: hypothetical protein R2811_08960 [Flavobacteriales bacterium]
MRALPILRSTALLALGITLVSASCNRDDDESSVNPTIQFVIEEGYTYQSDTVAVSDTLLVGVRISKGDDGLNIFKVLSKYDNGAEEVQDSLPIGTETFAFDKVIRIRPVAGTERWTFSVQETDGDIIRRALTFTVE